MNYAIIIFVLFIAIAFLFGVVVYQQFAFGRGTQSKLKQMSGKLAEILETDCDEKVMVFTDNKNLMELATQINKMLESRQKIKVDFKCSEISSKKMLSNISHDIKTPMTVILGYLEILRMNSSEQKEMLVKVEKKAEKVMELINQFFTLAKLEAGDMDVEISSININAVCKENILDFHELLIQKDIQVEVCIPENNISVQGNKDALQRIMFNLISNAIRYGADGNYLGLFLRTDKKFAYIDIVDKGKGIDKTFAENVFERLFTMEDSRNREIQGNGLGLTIAKNLALQLGGNILLESSPNEKTVFTVKLKRILF